MNEQDEVGKYGKAVEGGEGIEIERGGTIARGASTGHGPRPSHDEEGHRKERRPVPPGRTHGAL